MNILPLKMVVPEATIEEASNAGIKYLLEFQQAACMGDRNFLIVELASFHWAPGDDKPTLVKKNLSWDRAPNRRRLVELNDALTDVLLERFDRQTKRRVHHNLKQGRAKVKDTGDALLDVMALLTAKTGKLVTLATFRILPENMGQMRTKLLGHQKDKANPQTWSTEALPSTGELGTIVGALVQAQESCDDKNKAVAIVAVEKLTALEEFDELDEHVIVIATKGLPGACTRNAIAMIANRLQLWIMALSDHDPGGLIVAKTICDPFLQGNKAHPAVWSFLGEVAEAIRNHRYEYVGVKLTHLNELHDSIKKLEPTTPFTSKKLSYTNDIKGSGKVKLKSFLDNGQSNYNNSGELHATAVCMLASNKEIALDCFGKSCNPELEELPTLKSIVKKHLKQLKQRVA